MKGVKRIYYKLWLLSSGVLSNYPDQMCISAPERPHLLYNKTQVPPPERLGTKNEEHDNSLWYKWYGNSNFSS